MGKIGELSSGVIILSILIYFLTVCTFTVIGKLNSDVEEDLSMSGEQYQSLQEFKKMVMPRLEKQENVQFYMKSDFYLIRYLRAKNFDMKSADNMLMENFKWRKQWKIDGIHEEDWSDMYEFFPYDYDYDLKGRPVGMVNFADWDLRKAIASGKHIRLFRYLMKLVDEITEEVFHMQREGKNVTRWKLIFNMEGFNPVQHMCVSCLPGIPFLVNSYEDHYPGFADRIITINTPSIFQVVVNIAKPILTEPNRKALKTFGFNRDQWMQYLDQEISRESRTPEFGGTKKSRSEPREPRNRTKTQ